MAEAQKFEILTYYNQRLLKFRINALYFNNLKIILLRTAIIHTVPQATPYMAWGLIAKNIVKPSPQFSTVSKKCGRHCNVSCHYVHQACSVDPYSRRRPQASANREQLKDPRKHTLRYFHPLRFTFCNIQIPSGLQKVGKWTSPPS